MKSTLPLFNGLQISENSYIFPLNLLCCKVNMSSLSLILFNIYMKPWSQLPAWGSVPWVHWGYPVISFDSGQVKLSSFHPSTWRLYGFRWRVTISKSNLSKLSGFGCLGHLNLGIFTSDLGQGGTFPFKDDVQFGGLPGLNSPAWWAGINHGLCVASWVLCRTSCQF